MIMRVNVFKTITQVSSILLLTCLLSSCGFQLRGHHILPNELQTLTLTSVDQYNALTRTVKKHLILNQVNLVNHSDEAIPQLHLLKDQLDRRTLSLFNNGQVAEYEIIYTVKYQIIYTDGVVKDYVFELSRDYQDDPDLALAKSRELNLLLSEMRQEAADRILRNMASIRR